MNHIVRMIQDSVVVGQEPVAVFLSGGLDSSIVLHHVCEKSKRVHTFSAKFFNENDENERAQVVAEHYGTTHHEVEIKDIVGHMPEILKGLDHPRYNVWPWFLARDAQKAGCKTVFIGEGSDEHFGGYTSKDYLAAWADHLTYIAPLYTSIVNRFGMELEMPFTRLNWQTTRAYHENPNKVYLRRAYKGILQDFVLDYPKTAPAFTDYWQFWRTELAPLFPKENPKTVADVKTLLQIVVTRAWLSTREHIGV